MVEKATKRPYLKLHDKIKNTGKSFPTINTTIFKDGIGSFITTSIKFLNLLVGLKI